VERVLADELGQDLTKLAAEEKQRLLSRLLARLAHEIRNPLSSLAIHVQLLEEDMAQASPPLVAKSAAASKSSGASCCGSRTSCGSS